MKKRLRMLMTNCVSFFKSGYFFNGQNYFPVPTIRFLAAALSRLRMSICHLQPENGFRNSQTTLDI